MNYQKNFFKTGKLGFVLCAVLLGTLAGCVDQRDGPRAGPAMESYAFAGQDDYVYYPSYECYYSASRHQYAYREGNTWVVRPAPPNVSVRVLQASPSVKMDFHDSPANHHAAVVRQYPKNWEPTGADQREQVNHDNGQQDENNGR